MKRRIGRWQLPAQVRDAVAQERVGEQAHAVELDQDGGVAEEDDTVREVPGGAIRHSGV